MLRSLSGDEYELLSLIEGGDGRSLSKHLSLLRLTSPFARPARWSPPPLGDRTSTCSGGTPLGTGSAVIAASTGGARGDLGGPRGEPGVLAASPQARPASDCDASSAGGSTSLLRFFVPDL